MVSRVSDNVSRFGLRSSARISVSISPTIPPCLAICTKLIVFHEL